MLWFINHLLVTHLLVIQIRRSEFTKLEHFNCSIDFHCKCIMVNTFLCDFTNWGTNWEWNLLSVVLELNLYEPVRFHKIHIIHKMNKISWLHLNILNSQLLSVKRALKADVSALCFFRYVRLLSYSDTLPGHIQTYI